MFSCLILPFVQIFLFFTLQQSSANKFSLMHSHLHFRRKCNFSSVTLNSSSPEHSAFLWLLSPPAFLVRFEPFKRQNVQLGLGMCAMSFIVSNIYTFKIIPLCLNLIFLIENEWRSVQILEKVCALWELTAEAYFQPETPFKL